MLLNERLEPIYEIVIRVKAGLPAETSFLGFAGSPWTVATYMVAGQGTKDHGLARRMAYADPARFGVILDAITDLTVEYLAGQVETRDRKSVGEGTSWLVRLDHGGRLHL